MNPESEKHLDVYQNIEFGLKMEYEKNPNLTDSKTIFGLENASIAIKQQFGYANNQRVVTDHEIQGIIDCCVDIGNNRIDKINNLTLKEYTTILDTIKRSVKRHSEYGRRGYYEFIRNYVL